MSKQYQVITAASLSNGFERETIIVTATSAREAVTIVAQGRTIKGQSGELKVSKAMTTSITHAAFWVRKAVGAYMGEKWSVAEVVEAPAAEVVEAPAAEVVEAPAAEVVEVSTEEHTVTMTVEEKRAAWDIFVKEWAKGHAEDIHAIRAAEAKDATMDAEERLAYNEGRNEVKVYAETMSVADIEAHIAAYTSLFTDHLATVFANGMRTELAAITK